MDGMKTKRPLLLWVIIVLLTGLSCQTITGAPRPTPIPTWTGQPPTAAPLSSAVPEAGEIPSPIPGATQPESSTQTLAACPLDLQSRSMLPVTEPDWKQTPPPPAGPNYRGHSNASKNLPRPSRRKPGCAPICR